MGVLDTIKGLPSREGINGLIVDVLLAMQPLTAKQIYFKLKKRHGVSVSYQAVHKRLKALEKEGLLKKEELDYVINPAWLDQVNDFCSLVKNRLSARERVMTQLKQKGVSEKKNIKVVSLDLGGALFNNEFDELLWRSEIPRVYAEQFKISKEEAFERVTAEYRRLWGKTEGWRDPEFWLKHFHLNTTYPALIKDIKKHIAPYIDAAPILKKLSEQYPIIIISHAQENILHTKLKIAKYDKYFLKLFSTGTNFTKMTKDVDIYREICDELKIQPEELVHIGNNIDFDYKIPSSIGINAFLIDRIGHRKEPYVVRDLYEFEEKIRDLEAIQ
ncbi:MAG: HAD hydrolase-like protein [Candidatus Aenigmarchaeota archaeon]|nr:HAD hydrolase-like protein [Candidatus Aenigmarchaeota archaeon]